MGTAALGRREVEALQTEYLRKGDWPKITISKVISDAYFPVVNGLCHFQRSIPQLVTKPLVTIDVIYSKLQKGKKYVFEVC